MCNVATVNIKISGNVDIVNIRRLSWFVAKRKPYHHGDLRRALVEQALRTIQLKGVDALTLRGVGHSLGVSRTALYRHFVDKSALLSAVATEGFRTLRLQLLDAWERGQDRGSFDAMGIAYVKFAISHPSHYRVMFGASVTAKPDSELALEGTGAFQALVDALIALQKDGVVRQDDPLQLALFIWSEVHGIAMLAIDDRLSRRQVNAEDLVRYALSRLWAGMAA